MGTVFNTITKSGSNDYHGEASIFRRTPFSARPKLLPNDAPTPDVNVDSYVVDGGGRIVGTSSSSSAPSSREPRSAAPVTVPAPVIAQLGLPASYADAIQFRQERVLLHGAG